MSYQSGSSSISSSPSQPPSPLQFQHGSQLVGFPHSTQSSPIPIRSRLSGIGLSSCSPRSPLPQKEETCKNSDVPHARMTTRTLLAVKNSSGFWRLIIIPLCSLVTFVVKQH